MAATSTSVPEPATQAKTESTMLEKLRAKYGPEAKIAVVDESADRCGDAFFICVVSSAFDGVGLLDRQRSINETLATEIAGVHAVQVKAWTPSQAPKKIEKLPEAVKAALS